MEHSTNGEEVVMHAEVRFAVSRRSMRCTRLMAMANFRKKGACAHRVQCDITTIWASDQQCKGMFSQF
eukprot:461026-Pleurochrysis_carterae.AAC.2